MLDRAAYTAMTGAKHAMGQLAVTANNLANASTSGFREAIATFRAVPMRGERTATRTFVVDSTPGSSFEPGRLETTGNTFDMAIEGRGFFVVRRADGSEAYTRAGRFFTDENGVLRLGRALSVAGENGDITIPPGATVEVGADGTVTGRLPTDLAPAVLGRLRLVQPEESQLVRGIDGLFTLPDGVADPSPAVRVRQGALEGSNVNAADAMMRIITQTRLFEANLKVIQTADQNSRSANQLLSLSRG